MIYTSEQSIKTTRGSLIVFRKETRLKLLSTTDMKSYSSKQTTLEFALVYQITIITQSHEFSSLTFSLL